jgi:hypothetical protein
MVRHPLLLANYNKEGADRMKEDHMLDENPHETYNNEFRPLEQNGEPLPGSKKVKQENHSRQIKTREG